MSDGMAGAQLLSWQLTTYRMLDAMSARRTANVADAEIARAWAVTDEVIRRLDIAVQEYNTLVKAARTLEEDFQGQIVALKQRIARLEQENADERAAQAKADAEWQRYADGCKRYYAIAEQQIAGLRRENAKLREANARCPDAQGLNRP